MSQHEPRWLTTDEQAVWRDYLSMSQLVSDRLERQLQHEAGMPHAYYEVLVRLSEAPERTLRMSELAEASLSSRSRISHAVTRMEEQGWITRRSCDEDRRGQWAVLTDTGFAALHEAAGGHVEAVRRALFDALSPAQVKALGEISRTVLAALPAQPESS